MLYENEPQSGCLGQSGVNPTSAARVSCACASTATVRQVPCAERARWMEMVWTGRNVGCSVCSCLE